MALLKALLVADLHRTLDLVVGDYLETRVLVFITHTKEALNCLDLRGCYFCVLFFSKIAYLWLVVTPFAYKWSYEGMI